MLQSHVIYVEQGCSGVEGGGVWSGFSGLQCALLVWVCATFRGFWFQSLKGFRVGGKEVKGG